MVASQGTAAHGLHRFYGTAREINHVNQQVEDAS